MMYAADGNTRSQVNFTVKVRQPMSRHQRARSELVEHWHEKTIDVAHSESAR